MGERVFISIGSNSDEPKANCLRAIEEVKALKPAVSFVRSSSLFRTAPWGNTAQDDFFNSVIEIQTELEPGRLLRMLKDIEVRMGRLKGGGERWGARVIDFDIILFGERVVSEEELKIPHPRFRERAFVLVPLNEIASEVKDPVSGKNVFELAASVDKDGVELISEAGVYLPEGAE